MSSGKYYWEYGDVVSNEHIIGVVKASFLNPSSTVGTNDAYGYGSETGGKYDPVGGSNQSYGSSWTTGDTIGVAFDADNGNLYFYKNGTIQNSGNPAFTGLTDGPYLPSVVQNGSSRSAVLNFGQRPFKYQNAGTDRPSTDYKPLATSFLPEPTFKRPDEAFDIALWDGNGSSQTITYPRLSPDLIWLKERTNTSDGWWNTLSGVSKYLSSNLTDDEFDTTTEMNSLNEDGFTVGSSSMTNENSQDYVGWAWDAGEATTTISAGGSNSLATIKARLGVIISASFRSSEPATNAFDGDTSTIAGSAGSITYTSPVAVASSSTIRVIVHGGDHNVSVNSGANQTVAAGSFVTLNFTNPTNNTFTITFDRVAGGLTRDGSGPLKLEGSYLSIMVSASPTSLKLNAKFAPTKLLDSQLSRLIILLLQKDVFMGYQKRLIWSSVNPHFLTVLQLEAFGQGLLHQLKRFFR